MKNKSWLTLTFKFTWSYNKGQDYCIQYWIAYCKPKHTILNEWRFLLSHWLSVRTCDCLPGTGRDITVTLKTAVGCFRLWGGGDPMIGMVMREVDSWRDAFLDWSLTTWPTDRPVIVILTSYTIACPSYCDEVVSWLVSRQSLVRELLMRINTVVC